MGLPCWPRLLPMFVGEGWWRVRASETDLLGVHMQVIAVVLGAGRGTRMGAGQNKVVLPIAGTPILVRAIESLARCPSVSEIVLVAHPDEIAYCREAIVRQWDLDLVSAVIAGGDTRHRSEERALDWLRDRIAAGAIDLILIHDGARPFVRADDVERLIEAACSCGGALLAAPVPPDDMLATVSNDGTIAGLCDVAHLWRAQTPQAFDAAKLLAAYDRARQDGFEGTDTSASFERMGYAVQIVPGAATNIKITTPEDLLRAERIARSM
jgi:2-C-methyl-D-erythritol 4-phosphate cytidylyltransferase